MEVPGRRFENGRILYTDWTSRGGDGVIVRGEALAWKTSTAMDLVIEIHTKKSNVAGDGAQVGSWALPLDTTAGVQQAIYTSSTSEASAGMYDLVRLKITSTGGDDGDWIVARIFPLIFFDKSH